MDKTESGRSALRNDGRRDLGRILLTLVITMMVIIVPVSVMVTPSTGITIFGIDAGSYLDYQYDEENHTATVIGFTQEGWKRFEFNSISYDLTIPSEVSKDGETYTVTEINRSALAEKNIKILTIPSTVKTIGAYAFRSCQLLISVTIPESVTTIDQSAFSECTSLTQINVEGTNFKSIDGVLFNNDGTTLVQYPCGRDGPYKIPNGVETIGKGAFSSSKVSSVDFPSTVTLIDENSFDSCNNITKITIPDGIAKIMWNAFANCSSLIEVTLPNSVTELQINAFVQCLSLTTINTENVKKFDNMAFRGCKSLKTIDLSNATYLGDSLFLDCTSLTSVVIPEGVKNISTNLFCNCTSLKSISLHDGITSLGRNSFNNCSSLTSITIPNSIKSIESPAFAGCTSLTGFNVFDNNYYSSDGSAIFSKNSKTLIEFAGGKTGSYTIPDGIISIGSEAFRESKISTIDLNKIQNIGQWAFSSSSIEMITLPNTIVSIGNMAFRSCTSLKSITINGDVQNYSTKDGVLFDKEKTTLIVFPSGIEGKYTVPDTVSTISPYAFCGSNLTDVTIPDNVQTIGGSSFMNCKKLVSIDILAPITTLYENTFNGCSSLATIRMPSTITNIGNYVFTDCRSLTEITIPEGVTNLECDIFDGCYSLKTLNLSNCDLHVNNTFFRGCESLTTITVSQSNQYLSSIDGVLFSKDGKSLIRYPQAKQGEYTIPEGVTRIDERAFEDCSMKSIKIPASVTFIYKNAFNGIEFYESDRTTQITDYSRLVGNEFYRFDTDDGTRYALKGPEVNITSIDDWAKVHNHNVTIEGNTTGISVSITVNGVDLGNVPLDQGRFSKTITLEDGLNTIDVKSVGSNDSFTVKTLHVTYSDPVPVPENNYDWILLIVFIIATLFTIYVGVISRRE